MILPLKKQSRSYSIMNHLSNSSLISNLKKYHLSNNTSIHQKVSLMIKKNIPREINLKLIICKKIFLNQIRSIYFKMFNSTLNYLQLYLISFRKVYKLPLHSHCFFQFLFFVLQLREVLKRPLI